MKTPTKGELYAQIEALERENIKLQMQLDEEKQQRWLLRKGKAVTIFFDSVPFTPDQIWDFKLDHIDNVGYWFTFRTYFEQKQTQTYCVRHTDLEGKPL